MTVAPAEFIRRFMLHVLPKGFHRIRHYGLLAQQPHQGRYDRAGARADRSWRRRHSHAQADEAAMRRPPASTATEKPTIPARAAAGRMVIIETFEAGCTPRHRPTAPATAIRIDTS